METPDDIFILTLATSSLYPLQQDFVEAQGEKLGSSVDTMQYSGPYVLTEWKLDSSLTFTKNPEYWNADESFPVETVVLLKVDDANTVYSMFEAGEVDALAGVPAQYQDMLADYSTTQSGGDGLMYLWFNAGAEETEGDRVMANNNFRLALNYALDRSSIMAAVNPMMQPYSRLMIPVYEGLNGGSYVDEYPIECPPLEGDVEKAQEYLDLALEELGYTSVEELPTMNFVTWDADRQKLLCEAIIDQWKQNLGITSVQLISTRLVLHWVCICPTTMISLPSAFRLRSLWKTRLRIMLPAATTTTASGTARNMTKSSHSLRRKPTKQPVLI